MVIPEIIVPIILSYTPYRKQLKAAVLKYNA